MKLPVPHSDTPSLSEVAEMFSALESNRAPAWGSMDATQMVEHCARFGRLCLGEIQVGAPIRIAARLIGPLFVRRLVRRSPTATPRNLTTLAQIRSGAQPGDGESTSNEWESARANLTETLHELETLQDPHRHPLYGEMRADDVRALFCHHTAHHAHQFGLC